MRERVLSAGGTLSIDSAESGTTVTATLPLAHALVSNDGAGATSRPRLSA